MKCQECKREYSELESEMLEPGRPEHGDKSVYCIDCGLVINIDTGELIPNPNPTGYDQHKIIEAVGIEGGFDPDESCDEARLEERS